MGSPLGGLEIRFQWRCCLPGCWQSRTHDLFYLLTCRKNYARQLNTVTFRGKRWHWETIRECVSKKMTSLVNHNDDNTKKQPLTSFRMQPSEFCLITSCFRDMLFHIIMENRLFQTSDANTHRRSVLGTNVCRWAFLWNPLEKLLIFRNEQGVRLDQYSRRTASLKD